MRCIRLALLVTLPLVAMTGELRGQQEGGALVLGRRVETKAIQFNPAEFSLEFVTTYQRSSSQQSGGGGATSTLTLDELLNVSTSGSIIHPNVIALDLSGSFGLTQRSFSGDSSSGSTVGAAPSSASSNDMLYLWDARATFFRNEPFSLSVYTVRSRQNIARDFGPTLESTSTTYGATASYRSSKMPMTLNAYHREQEQQDTVSTSDPFSLSTFNFKEDVLEYQGQYFVTDYQSFHWRYSFNNFQDTSPDSSTSSQSNTSQGASVGFTGSFGAKRQHYIYSVLDYTTTTGEFDEKQLRFDNNLHLEHSDTFRTDYDYHLSMEEFSGQSQTNHYGMARFDHRLYNSLFTSGSVGGSLFDVDGGGGSQAIFGSIGTTYNKLVPLGNFSANVGFSISRTENEATGSPILFLNQAETFTDPIGITLTRQNIDPASIRITDTSGLINFREGIDYTVASFPGRVEIRRNPTGIIPDLTPVLVDYTVDPQPANTLTSTGFNCGARYDFRETFLKGLGVYARYSMQNQDVQSDVPLNFVAEDVRDLVVGADYRRGGFILVAEQEWRTSNLNPYDVTRFSAMYSTRLRSDLSLALGATYTVLDYTGDSPNHVDQITANASLDYRLGRETYARLTVLWRDENDDLFGKTRGFEQRFELRWRRRQTEIYLNLRNSMYETNATETDFQFLQFGIKRYF